MGREEKINPESERTNSKQSVRKEKTTQWERGFLGAFGGV